MASSLSFHSQLSSIMETMAKSALSEVCKLVDDDSAELRLELSRLLFANSALAEKVNSLECELTIVKSDAPELCKSYRTVGIQTVCYGDEDPQGTFLLCLKVEDLKINIVHPFHVYLYLLLFEFSVPGSPTIEGIFGKDWCMNLWKDRDPYSLDVVTESLHYFDKVRGRFLEVFNVCPHF